MFLSIRPSVNFLSSYSQTMINWRRFFPTVRRPLFPIICLLLLCSTAVLRWKYKDTELADQFEFFEHVPDKYIGSYFKYCNGIANQMYRYAALYAIGKEIGREPYIDSSLECVPRILPELSAAMPTFFKRLHLIPTPKSQVKRVDFAKNCCKYDNVSKLVGLHPENKYLKVNSNLLQSYKFFHHVKPKLRQIFEFSDSLKNYVHTYADQLFKNDTNHKFCVHTRLGDFKHHPYLLASKHAFTNPAVEFVGKEILKNFTKASVILLGTDKDFIDKIKIPPMMFAHKFQPTDLSRTEELYFGSKFCDSFLITASASTIRLTNGIQTERTEFRSVFTSLASGSTFAWWIAYLLDEEAQNRVYYNYMASKYKKFGKDTYDYDTFPPQWQRLRLFNVTKIGYEPRWHNDINDDKFSQILHYKG